MDLAPCPNCRRHVAASETSCPFCSAALSAASCGGQPKPTEAPRSQPRTGHCDDKPNEEQIEKLEKLRAAAKTDDEKALLDADLEAARHPVCNPYGAPPKRRRAV